MKLLLDENLSRRMAPLIASHYPGSSQVALLGLEHASDSAIWAYARQHDWVIVTRDSDFIDLSTLYGQPPKQYFGQFSDGDRLNDAVITKVFIVGTIFSQTPTLCQAR